MQTTQAPDPSVCLITISTSLSIAALAIRKTCQAITTNNWRELYVRLQLSGFNSYAHPLSGASRSYALAILPATRSPLQYAPVAVPNATKGAVCSPASQIPSWNSCAHGKEIFVALAQSHGEVAVAAVAGQLVMKPVGR